MKKHKNISRIDQPEKRTHCWYVRVLRNGKLHSKSFSDSKHGGKDTALQAAIAWRDLLLQIPEAKKMYYRKAAIGYRADKEAFYVTWRGRDGNQKYKSFSVKTLGHTEAKAQAREFQANLKKGIITE